MDSQITTVRLTLMVLAFIGCTIVVYRGLAGRHRQKTWFRWLRNVAGVLLVVVTIGGVVLLYGPFRQARSLARIQELGGRATILDIELDKVSPLARPLCPLLGEKYFGRVYEVTLREAELDAQDYARLHRLNGLSILDLGQTKTDDSKLKSLQTLGLGTLRLDSTLVTDAGMATLARFGDLHSVSLSGTSVGDAGVAALQPLALWRGKPFPLSQLHLAQTQVTDRGLETISHFGVLEDLNLAETRITDAGLKHLEGLSIRRLNLSGTQITDDGLTALESLAALRWLTLDQTAVTDAGLSKLAPLALVDLSLRDTEVTDAGLPTLQNFQYLKSVDLSGTRVTAEGVAALRKAMSGTQVKWAAAE